MRRLIESRPRRSSVLVASLLLAASAGLWGEPVASYGQRADQPSDFRSLYQDFRERMNDDLDDAAEYLESAIAKSPNSLDLNLLRHTLAAQFARQEQYADALEQFQRLLDFQIAHAEIAENQIGIWMTVQSIRKTSSQTGDDGAFDAAVKRSLDTLTKIDPDAPHSLLFPVSQLTALRAQALARDDQLDAAMRLIEDQLSKLSQVNESAEATEDTMQAQVRMLRSLISSDRENDSWRDTLIPKVDEVVAAAIDRFPESPSLQSSYADIQLMMITEWGQNDPEATVERIELVRKKLGLLASRNRGLQAILRRMKVRQQQILNAKPVASLVGNQAPAWDADAWVNSHTVTRESFQGDVVLLDFWAMWCGPCIATFPHLRQWREEFGGHGFEIVGVTQYYNFQWDDQNQRAHRGDDAVAPEDERETLRKFLQHHQLEHPVMVTADGSEMPGAYGVRGIPHVVLIDREGVVQLVRTGAGETTAAEIHAKIKELVEAPVALPK